LSGGEGRKPGAETQSEGKAGGTAARRCPEGETGRVGRKPDSNGSRRTSGREEVVGLGLKSSAQRKLKSEYEAGPEERLKAQAGG